MPASPFKPVAPVFATANENFLLIVISSTVIGITASQAFAMVAVVVKVMVGADVPLPSTTAEMPVGHAMFFESTITDAH